MNQSGFIKLNRTNDIFEIIKNYPQAFVLLTVIALRAKRTDEFSAANLKQGQAMIGDYSNYGMSRAEYRRAIKKLTEWKFVTTKSTNKGTIATLCNSAIYDINIGGHEPTTSQQRANNEPTNDHQRATNKNVKNERGKEWKNEIEEIISFLNSKAGTNYRASTETTKSKIKARMKEGFKLDDFKKVISKKVTEWSGTEMEKFLRPQTLFGPKFESYLNQKIVDPPPGKNTNNYSTWSDAPVLPPRYTDE